jgi:undecaprenyl-phosphate 4-deoxy-4-formamido-L-arabinose transferase
MANLTADFLMSKPKGLYLSSFRCLKACVARETLRYSGPFPYVDGLIMQVTQNVGQLEVEHLPRAIGKSNYALRKLIRLWLSIAMNFSVVPLRISSLLGICLSVMGAIAALLVIYEAISYGNTPRGWASVMAALLLLSGFQMLMLGIIGEYLGRLFLSVNNKPQWVLRRIYRPRDEQETKSQPAAGEGQTDARAGT